MTDIFTSDLRRVLYLGQVYREALTWLKDDSICPTHMKVDINNGINAINRFILNCRSRTTPETFEAVMRELNSEELKDISLLLDFASGINNVGAVVDVLTEHLNTQDNGTI